MRPVLLSLLALGLAASPADAGEGEFIESVPGNGFGSRSFSLGAGLVSERATLASTVAGDPEPSIDNLGSLLHARVAWARYFAETRFRTMIGLDVRADLGWFSASAIDHDAGRSGMTLGRLFFDTSAALLVSPVWGTTWRVAGVAGGALGSDVAAVRLGAHVVTRTHGAVIELGAELRPSRAWKRLFYVEQRVTIRVASARRGWGVLIEGWRADAAASNGHALRARALRGDYATILLALEYRE